MRFKSYDELCKYRTPLNNATYITDWRFKDEVHIMKDERVANSVERGMSKSTSNNVCVEFNGRDFLDILRQISDGAKLIADVEKYHAEHDSDSK